MKAKILNLVLAQTFRRDSWLRRAVAAASLFVFTRNALANPTGMTVQSGNATFTFNGSQLTVNAGNNAVLNWQSFNIAAGETTTFNQPSASSIVWNRINNNQGASQIYGSLHANGVVVLLNSSGFYFGPNSFVSAAGLVISTANCTPPQNSGGSWQFNGPPPLMSIVNYGTIKIGNGGDCYLIADKVENHGDIETAGGNIGLAAGQTVTLSERPDGRGMSMNVTLPQGSVDNYGNLIADGGTIALNAKVVNQNGLIQANSVQSQNGVIELVAADQLNLGVNSQTIANGDNSSGGSSGGNITLASGNNFSDSAATFDNNNNQTGAASEISVAGGANGGNGGNISISAPAMTALNSTLIGSAKSGAQAGSILVNADNIQLDDSGANVLTDTLDINVAYNNPFSTFSRVALQASGNPLLGSGNLTLGTGYNLSYYTYDDNGNATLNGLPGGKLILQAANNITFQDYSGIYDASQWSVNLEAGYNFAQNKVIAGPTSGMGSIFLNGGIGLYGSGSIQTSAGAITLVAAEDIQVSYFGSVTTIGGGSINVDALGGSVNTTVAPKDAVAVHGGYTFSSLGKGYTVDGSNLGGISTAAGGDVNIVAGQDVISYLPAAGSNPGVDYTVGDTGCGAFGPEAGNVTVIAGHNVSGHYVLANGTGIIQAANDAGTSGAALALSLIAGGWSVNAGDSIFLQEVRNPNGIFNNRGGNSTPVNHLFDYAPDDYVNLNAGNKVELSGGQFPRNTGENIPAIYPGILNIIAGQGGVAIDSKVILFPSPLGSLYISTTGGGALTGPSSSNPTPLIISDSGQTRYLSNDGSNPNYVTPFENSDHAATPIHSSSPTLVLLNISGDMNNIYLTAPEAATINVGGNMNNCRFLGQNLNANDITSIKVAGNIENRNVFTTVTLASPPDLTLLSQGFPTSYADLENRLTYNAATGQLTLQGTLAADEYKALTSLKIQVHDAYGNPEFDAQGVPVTAVVSILHINATDPTVAASNLAAVNSLSSSSQDVPKNPNSGLILGGGGQFNISADNMDLGSTLGIQSVGCRENLNLAKTLDYGAAINVDLAGNLDMFSTTISSINGGSVSVFAGGNVNVGSSYFTGDDTYPRGIYSVEKSDVTVVANGNIDINGSRIAAYDGGNVKVESLNGNIDAGTGGRGTVAVNEIYVDPLTHKIYSHTAKIPGSGILATTLSTKLDPTFPVLGNIVGNILVETPNGNIVASKGGIVQLALNGVKSTAPSVTLLAGYELQNGQPVQTSLNRNIDVTGSGVIAENAKLKATGNIAGVVFANNNIDISAQQNVSVTALAQGSVSASAGGTVSGTLVGVGGVSASGSSIDANLESNNAISGDTTGSKGFAQGTAANSTSLAASADDSTPATKSDDTDDELKKKGKGINLAQKVSRVTVILPVTKRLSEKSSGNNPL